MTTHAHRWTTVPQAPPYVGPRTECAECGLVLPSRNAWTTPKQSRADRVILAERGHPDGPQYIGPRQVDRCTDYDEHRMDYFYRRGTRWYCALDEEG